MAFASAPFAPLAALAAAAIGVGAGVAAACFGVARGRARGVGTAIFGVAFAAAGRGGMGVGVALGAGAAEGVGMAAVVIPGLTGEVTVLGLLLVESMGFGFWGAIGVTAGVATTMRSGCAVSLGVLVPLVQPANTRMPQAATEEKCKYFIMYTGKRKANPTPLAFWPVAELTSSRRLIDRGPKIPR